MAQAKTTTKLVVFLGDGANPEVFGGHPCSINTNREFTIEATTQDFSVPDCENMDAPSWQRRIVDTLSAGFQGAGTLDTASFAVWRTWMLSGAAKNVRVALDVPEADGGGYFACAMILANLGISKEGKGLVQFSCTLSSDGEVVWEDA